MKTKVFTSGCWDLLHIGHIRFLQKAKALGDYLVVGVATDERMLEVFNKTSIIPYEQRKEMVAALSCVDAVEPHDSDGLAAIEKHGVTIRVVCPEHLKDDRNYGIYRRLKAHGVSYVAIPRTPDISTTIIKERCYEQIRQREGAQVDSQNAGSDSNSGGITSYRFHGIY